MKLRETIVSDSSENNSNEISSMLDEESLFLQLEENSSNMRSIDDDSIIPINNNEFQGVEFEESPITVSDDSNDDEKIEDGFNVSNDLELGNENSIYSGEHCDRNEKDDSLIDRLSNLEEEIKNDMIENQQLLDATIEEEDIDVDDTVEDHIF